MADGNDATFRSLLGDHIRAAITRSGMTRLEMAQCLGVHPTTLYRMLKGDVSMSVDTLRDISDVLNVPTECLIIGDLGEEDGKAVAV